jgi:hypothetical protein
MVKSLFFYFYLLLTVSCIRPDIQGNISVSKDLPIITTPELPSEIREEPIIMEKPITPYYCLMDYSEQFVGVTEKGGNNKDFNNKELKQLLVNAGWKPGQAWCSYMVKGLLDHCNIPNTITGWSPTSYNKKDVIFTNNSFKKEFEEDDVLVMSLSYNKFKNDKARYKGIGHTGLIEKVREKNVITREGNTGDDGGRDGDGFYKKIRPLTNNLHITRWN